MIYYESPVKVRAIIDSIRWFADILILGKSHYGLYIAEYEGKRYAATYNHVFRHYYIDDEYGKYEEEYKCQ